MTGKEDEVIISLDLETTGLDPATGRVLEVGYVTLRCEGGQWISDGGTSWVCPLPPALLRALCCDRVWVMHQRGGLVGELTHAWHTAPESTRASDERWEELRQRLLAVRQETGQGATLLGFNPSFDMGWLRRHQPAIARLFHYRQIDVGVFRRVWPDLADEVVKEGRTYTHRAMDDARFALSMFKAAVRRARR